MIIFSDQTYVFFGYGGMKIFLQVQADKLMYVCGFVSTVDFSYFRSINYSCSLTADCGKILI